MISQTSEESIATALPGAEREPRQTLQPRKLSGKTFDFLWKRESRREKKEENHLKREEARDVKIVELRVKNAPSTKMPFDFFRNIKKHMHIKNLMTCKSKQKMKEIEASSLQNSMHYDSNTLQSDRPTIPDQENDMSGHKCDNTSTSMNVSYSEEIQNTIKGFSQTEHSLQNLSDTLNNTSNTENRIEINAQPINMDKAHYNHENVPTDYQSCSNIERQEVQHNRTTETVTEHLYDNVMEDRETQSNITDPMSNDNKVKASLAEELLKLSKHGWYWGPISGDEADAKLQSEPDGAFLVRDSSDDRYVLTLSFKSSGKLLHSRMEHSGSLFSLCNQSESEGFTSVAALINHSMNFSQSAVFCYSRPKYPGHPSFPVRLTKPVSRFTQVRSLQYLCRFVIRQNTRLDNIYKLPLPPVIKGYIEEAHY